MAMLVVHGVDTRAAVRGVVCRLSVRAAGDRRIPRCARWRCEARHEYAEYYFLFPLFVSITLLTTRGLFRQHRSLIATGIATIGQPRRLRAVPRPHGAVGDPRQQHRRRLRVARPARLELPVLHLFAMAQIAGYALGGCWTHIGSAQSVVAYAFIQRDVDSRYTPVQWIREMTPVILERVLAWLRSSTRRVRFSIFSSADCS